MLRLFLVGLRYMRPRPFLAGMREFRLTVTTHYDDPDDAFSYDWGREVAHRITFRHYDAV